LAKTGFDANESLEWSEVTTTHTAHTLTTMITNTCSGETLSVGFALGVDVGRGLV
jgi:hypothetical protein